jgi:hypothetical protein
MDKGRITLTALDGAHGSTESYTWLENGETLGTGKSLTVNFKRGAHTVTLRVDTSSGFDLDTITFYYGVSPPQPPSPGITVSPTSGLTTTEGGGTDTFTVVLDTKPVYDVTIGVSSGDTTEGTVSTDQLLFTPSNWDTPQTVTVTGVDDDDADGDVFYSIVLAAASSGDSEYNGLDPDDVSATNEDDEGVKTYSSTDVPKSIPDLGSVASTLSASDGPTAIASLNVTLSISHNRPGDLTVVLTSPSGTEETISGTSGTFSTESLAGETSNGTWTLTVSDGKKKQTGTLLSWSITVR